MLKANRRSGGTKTRLVQVAATMAGLALIPGFAPASGPGTCVGEGSCTSCHDFAPGLSHPVDIVPHLDIPADLPLESGRMTCLTCHDPESGLADQLRYAPERGGDICTACHDHRAADRVNAHAMATMRAHLDPPSRRHSAGRPASGPDIESTGCLSCHDGALARGDMFRLGPAPISSTRFIDGQHPIGVRQGPRWQRDNILPPERVDPAIRLYDGKLGCGSCHTPYSEFDNLLVMSNHRSRLCLSCHDF